MENECYYISSRGLLKSCTHHSLNPISSCNNDTEYLIKMLNSPDKMFDGMSIYVCSDLLSFFVTKMLSHIKHKFTLVSGDSDMCVPKEALSQRQTYALLQSPYLIKWFAQNTRVENCEKLCLSPIGLDYHTILTYPNCNWRKSGEDQLPSSQEDIITMLNIKSPLFHERIPKVYVNFSINNDRFNQRKRALNVIPKNLLHVSLEFKPRTDLWNEMIDYTFVLSPTGVGLDCHRTWEALILGCIPIVCVKEFNQIFNDLPVLLVNDWTEINNELLKRTIDDFKRRTFNYDKLTLEYWVNKINSK